MRALAPGGLVALALWGAGAATARAEDYYVMIVLPDQMFAADLDSQVREGDYATVQVLYLAAGTERIGFHQMKSSVSTYRHDCVRRTMTSLGTVTYDADGKEIGRSGPTGEVVPLRAEDGGALALICERKTEPWMVHFPDKDGVRRFYDDWLREHAASGATG
ncbi:surface-adhesin E family protein [Caulobacter sp. 17J65-9]|uniref:surface-adhesin E family protein n=1 Tax=Caulobacter sp. 17J65-9 TaxID=2709382 RepID=UPI0013C79CA1|nr:surface-adhesin E family protein [Caulobacter sp. 17J65-9]NEX94477.1 hypothetical protein [Caulobacter sp. 17J65-9]